MVWPNVDDFTNGVDKLDAETLNKRLRQLVARTEQLKTILDNQASRTNVAIDAELQGETTSNNVTVYPQLGQPVYRVAGGNAYAKAAAIVGDVEESKWFWADQQAMAVGVVGSAPSGSSATVVLNGYIAFVEPIAAADVIVDPEPASGRYFLSTTAGKLTAAPVGPIVYVCDCEIRGGKIISMLVNPQYRDTGESHIHRAFVLSGMPSGYAFTSSGRYRAADIPSTRFFASLKRASDDNHTASAPSDTVMMRPYGNWLTSRNITYTVKLEGSGTAWSGYKLAWESSDHSDDGVGTATIAFSDSGISTRYYPIGRYGLKVQLRRYGTPEPRSFFNSNDVSDTWSIVMPDAGRGWIDYWDNAAAARVGYMLNLGMYLEMARFVPPLPANGASLTVDGVELRSNAFGSRKRWEILPANSADGGPWLCWYGGEVAGVSFTAPFKYNEDGLVESQASRDIILHVNRMRVGPTGFVTSLQAAPGSPLKVTSAQTGANAAQGALQVGLDIDFKSTSGNAEGHEVVKSIVGSTFVTGPVVERVVAGPGMAVDRQQGIVTVSASNAVYAGDFETIALKNAKQDLAGGVFPYTKLLRWNTSGTNIDSGFTAKFRVPDHMPYNAGKGYYVVVSASVFGEAAAVSAATAAFRLTGYALSDQACTPDASGTFDGSIASPTGGYAQVIGVPFASGYTAFDPVLVHGFGKSASDAKPGTLVLPDTKQRVSVSALWLLASASEHMVVYPGYFVGLSIERCGLPENSTVTPYTPAIGFLSLRWNLVAVA